MTRRTSRSLCLSAFALALSLGGATAAFAGTANTSALRQGGSYDRFIVTFAKGSAEIRSHAARQSLLDTVGNRDNVDVAQLRRLAIGADVIRTHRKLDRAAAEAFMRRLAANPRVASVELDALRKPAWTPNDSYFNYQWHYFEPLGGINLPAAWDRTHRLGSGVVVAVIDTGITTHGDLAANVLTGYDFISDAAVARDGNGRDVNPQDQGDWAGANECEAGQPAFNSSWHGTHVAGTIAAVTNNGAGLAGVAPLAKIVPARALGKCGGFDSDIIDAITWASGGTVAGAPVNANVAEVVNLSLGSDGTCGTAMQAAIDGAVGRGAVVVVAAGNENQDATYFSPASCNNVITVGAVGRTGARASYSNFGAKLDLSAPGGDGNDAVVSIYNAGTTVPVIGDAYAPLLGTSMAAPHVSGVVALMQAVKINTPAAVETALKSSARAFPVACTLGCGAGILDANATLAAAAPTLSVADVVVREGNAGTTTVTFVATLDRIATAPVTFHLATANGTATAGVDYVASAQNHSIATGTLSKAISVTINGDTTLEPNETFAFNLSLVNGASVVDAQAIASIAEDDMTVSIADLRGTEGHSGTRSFGVTTSLSQPSLLPVTVKLYTGATGANQATAGVDYTAIALASAVTVTIPAGSLSKNTSLTVTGDATIEPNETFGAFLTAPVGANLGDLGAIVTILNDEGPTLSIANVALIEGHSGTRVATFTATLSQVATVPVSYTIFTSDGTATSTAGSDFVARSMSDTIAAGTLAKTFTVTFNGDTTVEANETFNVHVINATGASLYVDAAVGTILNDDGPLVSMPADFGVYEGQSTLGQPAGNTVDLAVTLSQAIAGDVECTAKSYDDSATIANADYVAVSRAVTIPAGQTSTTLPFTINADRAVEADERMRIDLTCANLVGATLYDARTWIYFTNDDAVPTFSVGDAMVTEGNSGTTTAAFTVSLSTPTNVPVTFNVATANNIAAAGSDYTALASTPLTIPAGAAATTVNVTVHGDTLAEPNETFWLNATNVVGATVADAQGMGVIGNDEGPTLRIADASVTEGNSGTKVMTFTVTLSTAAATAVTYDIATVSGGTAASGTDYVASTLTGQSIAAGTLSKTFSVTLNGDTTAEPNETLLVRLTGATVSISDDYATGTITDDDAPPTLSLGDVGYTETDGGRLAYIPLTLSKAASGPVTCDATTAPGTATANSDYDPNASQHTIDQGDTNDYLVIQIYGDHTIEADETVLLTLTCSALANAVILDGQAVHTIINDDGPPTLSVADVSKVEGNSGSANVTFTIKPSWTTTLPITVEVSTGIELSATAFDGDFTQVPPTTVTIPANTASATFSVAVKGDTKLEPNEVFSLNLANATNATIADAKAWATIINDEGPTLSIAGLNITEGNGGGTTVGRFTVTLSQAITVPVTFDIYTANYTGTPAATANVDYLPNALGGVTIPAGATTATFDVAVVADNAIEGTNELFTVNLANATGATIYDDQAFGQIVEDDFPQVYLEWPANEYWEGDSNWTYNFTPRLTTPLTYTLTARFETQCQSGCSDYYPVYITVTFPAGSTYATQSVPMTIIGDNLWEPISGLGLDRIERLCASPTWQSGGAVLGNYSCLTIWDDD